MAKVQSTYDELMKKLTPKQRKKHEEEYRDLVLSEMILAEMEKDNISVRRLAQEANVSPTIVQGLRSGTRKQTAWPTLLKVLNALGYSVFAEKNGDRIPLDPIRT